ncbi:MULTISPECIES: ATP-binding cassette domain-containing protein [Clostridium]|uniref:ATP-binding cassette domain-containing protein n=3 Tax=Clostridium TaxID=1485 RepID=UPI0024BABB16|nr:ABC transporter ATP-binding protein [Clostridium butanoliproducens]
MINIVMKSVFDMIYDIFEHVKRIPLEVLNKFDSVYLNQRINSDSNEIISYMTNNFIGIILNSLNICIISTILLKISYKISVMLFFMIPVYLSIYFLFKNLLYKYNKKLKEVQNKYMSVLNSQITNVKLIKMNSCFEFFSNSMKKAFKEYFKLNFKTSFHNINFNFIGLITSSISTILLCLMGFFEIKKGNLSVGKFIAINNFFPMLVNSIEYFFQLGSSYQKANASYQRIIEILQIDKEKNGLEKLDIIDNIRCENVSFSYNGCKNVIDKFTYEFKKGNIYCILGGNGKGKTTLINILTGLYQSFDGQVLYNDTNINSIDMYDLRHNKVSVSEQEPMLIQDSIENNITYDNKNIENKMIEHYINKFDLNKFNLDYEINSGNNISGGEKQKISLIKCFSKKSNLIILDEPSSALDSKSIEILKSELCELKKENIIIIITHNYSFEDICNYKICL